jgi:hypothetical protein
MSSHRASYDVLLDNIVSRLDAYSTDQEQIDPRYAFSVYGDWFRDIPPEDSGHALVLVYLGPVTAETDGSEATGGQYGYQAQYWIDCLVHKGSKRRTGGERADSAAASRARYLTKQVIDGLDLGRDRDLGLPQYTVRSIDFPRIEPFAFDLQIGEFSYAGSRVSLDVDLAYLPETPDGTDIDKLSIADPDRWEVLLDY